MGSLLLLLDGVQLQLLLALEIGFGKRRMENDIGKQIERRIELGLQRREPHVTRSRDWNSLKLRAQQSRLVADLERVARCACRRSARLR